MDEEQRLAELQKRREQAIVDREKKRDTAELGKVKTWREGMVRARVAHVHSEGTRSHYLEYLSLCT